MHTSNDSLLRTLGGCPISRCDMLQSADGALALATPSTIYRRPPRPPLALALPSGDLQGLIDLPDNDPGDNLEPPPAPAVVSATTRLAELENSLDPAGRQDLAKLVSSWNDYDERQKSFHKALSLFFQEHPQFKAGRPLLLGPRFLAQAKAILNDPAIISAWTTDLPGLPKLRADLAGLIKAANEHQALLEVFAGIYEIPMADSVKLWGYLVCYKAAGVGRGLKKG
jgi:hypothetical protein